MTGKNNGMPPDALRKAKANVRKADVQAGVQMAQTTWAPLIQREYFLRGMRAGALLTTLAGLLLWYVVR